MIMNLPVRRLAGTFLSVLPAVFLFVMVAHGAYADTCTSGNSNCVVNPAGNVQSVDDFLKMIFQVVMRIGVIIISVAIVLVGFQFVLAQGKPEAIKTARTNFLYTIVGASLILGAWIITTILSSTANSLSTS